MAEEQQGQEKTEEATPRKLEKAKEEGQVARSRELNSVAIVTFGAAAAIMVAPELARSMLDIARNVFASAAQTQIPMPTYLGNAILEAMWSMLPFSLIMFAAGVISSLSVGGVVFSAKAFQPKASRMSPIKGLGRMFSIKSLVELGKSVAKVLLVAGVATAVLSTSLRDLMVLGGLPIDVAIAQGLSYVGWALLLIGLALIFVAAIDVPFQIAQHKKQLKMTKQEVKDELKDAEGKPEVKARIRSLQQQLSRRKILEEVPTADVVITNPEHFSVAVRYDSKRMLAPVLVAKGVDHMAIRIREVALHHEVPMVPVPALARAIYYSTDDGEEIPAGLYIAVAQVLAYIYQLEQYKRGQIVAAPILNGIDVPEEFALGDVD